MRWMQWTELRISANVSHLLIHVLAQYWYPLTCNITTDLSAYKLHNWPKNVGENLIMSGGNASVTCLQWDPRQLTLSLTDTWISLYLNLHVYMEINEIMYGTLQNQRTISVPNRWTFLIDSFLKMLAHFAYNILQDMLGNGCDAKFRPDRWNFRLGLKQIMKKMK